MCARRREDFDTYMVAPDENYMAKRPLRDWKSRERRRFSKGTSDVLERVSVRENDNKAIATRKQGRSVFDALGRLNRAQKDGSYLRVKRYANNELRVSWGQARPAAKRSGSEAGVARCLEVAEATLVYSGKVAHRGDLVLPAAPRARGKKPTRDAMHMVREACWILEEKYQKDAQFITLTLAGRTPDAIEQFAEHSSGIMKALIQRYRDFLKKVAPGISGKIEQTGVTEFEGGGPGNAAESANAFDCDYVWVAENHKDGVLHFHLVIGIENKQVVRVLRKRFKKWWRNILLTYSEKTGVDLFARTNGGTWKDVEGKPRVQFVKVKYSVSRYISKYISKGVHSNPKETWSPPACWYSLSGPLRKRVVAERHSNAITFLTINDAEQAAVQLAAYAQDLGSKILTMKNPITQEPCGFVVYLDDWLKDWVYESWNLSMEHWEQSPDVVRSRDGPRKMWCGCEVNYLREVDEIFAGSPVPVEGHGCAVFCAPFSAPEKGGGMRYN